MEYGLIGEKLGHSFSKQIHESLSNYSYELKELSKEEFPLFMEAKAFKAINVTIPYKEKVIPYLDSIDPIAKRIGAVNTICNKDGHLYGYNTDYYGLKSLIIKDNINIKNKKVLILGTGGTSKTSSVVCEDLGAKEIIFVSRTKTSSEKNIVTYDEAYEKHYDASVIINTTPCGMYPNIFDKPIDLDKFSNLESLVDVIFNPLQTTFLCEGKERGLKVAGGLYMLVMQAYKASMFFTNNFIDKEKAIEIYKELKMEKLNYVLIGMPSCGKSSYGKEIARIKKRKFIDIDELIVNKINMPIKDYFSKYGEDAFRDIEEETIKEVSIMQGVVIATGGGSILRNQNMLNLKKNGIICFIDRPLDDLTPTSDRPLSMDIENLKKRYVERYPIYKKYADAYVKNNQSYIRVVNKIMWEVEKCVY